MRIVQRGIELALLASLALAPKVASAQAGGFSDSVSETIVDLGTGGLVPITFGPSPVHVTIPEGTSEPPIFITMPARQIDFIEGPTQGQISDRLTISQYEVRVQSDGDPGGLPRGGPGVILIPASALETFQPIRIEAKSDGELVNGIPSDSLTITLGYYGPGTGTPLPGSPFIIPPVPEGTPEMPITVTIPSILFDIAEPGGAEGFVSDYFDMLEPITVTYISSDNPLDYQPLPPNGVVLETIEGGGVLYALDFVSDVDVPEPASCILLSLGLVSVGFFGRRRQLR